MTKQEKCEGITKQRGLMLSVSRSCITAWFRFVRKKMKMSDTLFPMFLSCYSLPEAWALIPAVLSSLPFMLLVTFTLQSTSKPA